MTADLSQIKQRGARFWDSNPCGGFWTTYREFMDWIRQTEPYFFDILDSYDWRGQKVIEVGCGQGTTLNYLPQHEVEMTGLDMSFQSIQAAQAGALELDQLDMVQLLQADAEYLPFANEIFDAVISCGVLHHTSDTAGGIRNIHRILKPGGTAVVMLYHSGNPKWWATNLFRTYSRLVDYFFQRSGVLAESLRSHHQANSTSGTALLELYGVPILKAFSNKQTEEMFSGFSEIKISNHQPGFRRLVDVIPVLSRFSKVLAWLDQRTINKWGFYQVIEARK
jgi:ubiquinone/menaquinone biosynthesis C-methylase UbiE